MNVGIVIDATCDLPSSIIERYQVNVLPIHLEFKNISFTDKRLPEQSNQFYKTTSNQDISNGKISPATTESFSTALAEKWLYQFDNILVIAPHRKINATLQSVRLSILEMQSKFEQLRMQANLKPAFKIRVIESQSGFAGYGVVLYEALQLASEKARSADQLKQPLDQFIPRIETYVLPGNANINPHLLGQPPFNLGWIDQKKIKLTKRIPFFKLDIDGVQQCKLLPIDNIENNFLEIIYDKLTRTKLKNHLVNIS